MMKAKMLCQSCNRSGLFVIGGDKPRWCRCPKGQHGPIVAAPGTVIVFHFESAEESAFREQCRLVSNAERQARDNLSDRYVRCGRGYRELPPSSPKRKALEAAYDAALEALEALQAKCSHPSRCHYNEECCDVCRMHVVSNIEQHRHLVREGFFDEAC